MTQEKASATLFLWVLLWVLLWGLLVFGAVFALTSGIVLPLWLLGVV